MHASAHHPQHEPAHGQGLADDLPLIQRQLRHPPLQGRRRTLAWLAGGVGSVLLHGCGGGEAGTSSSTTGSSTDSSTGSSSSTGSTSGSASGSTSTGSATTGSCTAAAQETAGPYPADGTNTSSSSLSSDVLTATGVVRSDIRSSFLGSSTTEAPGVPVTLSLQLVNTNGSCAALEGYAVYLWHCDRDGEYSLYGLPAESYLRGVQVSDSAGQVTFTTIFPGCYSGRYPHIHFEVFRTLASATNGRNAVLTSQLALPSAVCSAVYTNATGYSTSTRNFAGTSISSDNVFGDNTSAQMAAMTPAMDGSVALGYTGTATIGLAV